LKKKANEKKVCRPVVSKDAHPENVEHRYHMYKKRPPPEPNLVMVVELK